MKLCLKFKDFQTGCGLSIYANTKNVFNFMEVNVFYIHICYTMCKCTFLRMYVMGSPHKLYVVSVLKETKYY